MSDFKILVADDHRHERELLAGLVHQLRPELEVKKVADAAQAVSFFEENRSEARNILVLSDGQMHLGGTETDYRDTDYPEPSAADCRQFGVDFRNGMDKLIEQWKPTHKIFAVMRTGAYDNSHDLESLAKAELGNSGRKAPEPFLISKKQERSEDGHLGNYMTAILDHCDRLFSV